jgi:hypothetical protein
VSLLWNKYKVLVSLCNLHWNFWLKYLLYLLGSFGTIFCWFWLIWQHNHWFLLGKLFYAFCFD